MPARKDNLYAHQETFNLQRGLQISFIDFLFLQINKTPIPFPLVIGNKHVQCGNSIGISVYSVSMRCIVKAVIGAKKTAKNNVT